ncbi:MAG: segregation and condensation protein A, partial [Anaerolineae bacterium]
GRRSFVRVAPPPKIEPRLTPGQLTIDDLLAAVRQALAVQPEPPGVGSVVSREVITIGGQITAIRTRLASGRPVRFTRLLSRTPSRIEIIVTLLAVLELIKRRVIDVEQAEAFGEINITPVDISLSDDDWEALSQLEKIS